MRLSYALIRATALLFTSTLILSGCAAVLDRPVDVQAPSDQQLLDWGQHRDRVESLNDWQFEGRAAIRSGISGGSVRVDWTQVGDVTALRLNGPFDSGTLALTGTVSHMLITDGRGNSRMSETPIELLEEQTGWRVPLDRLPRWVRGLPSGNLAQLPPGGFRLDAQGRLVYLQEQEWQIEYDRYQSVSGYALPHFIELENPDIRIRMIVDRWKLKADARD